ncbi:MULTISPECIES: ribosomal protein S18-alanine N-acetyltransferase [unclassified Lactococcus]|uniref:ribosomal protein S18-alanine N-acetyltransferase n=1 Tax=unclassified Lactococcus TaxID=2643510 RepID=UPI0011CC2771|nr:MULTISPECIES: ribosomal protein S18-alanine N-acetyltransferase [unclassified Lactococcus]MQW22910.1 ribosomal-protein-alanine N-acetyltransferase [Lactococcus sp. dk101]TXK44543.1 ribosomal-protein-alanine N-acetyltransferase [Lactococcus sp. dk310]TXK50396.1 ribosomal-protein-alanine N-acetyltransferase [Lactococcus sp. dk322]
MLKIRQCSHEKGSNEKDITGIFQVLSENYSLSPWSHAYIENDLATKTSRYFVIEDAQEIVGFLAVTEVINEIEITNIAIKPAYHHQGLASRLLDQLPVNWADKAANELIETVFLEVRASNLPAQKLYQKFGFEAYHIRKNYYSMPQEDAILMRLNTKN